MVLDEHKESEQKFHNQAGKTMETLQTALNDVQGLHQKIGIYFISITPSPFTFYLLLIVKKDKKN